MSIVRGMDKLPVNSGTRERPGIVEAGPGHHEQIRRLLRETYGGYAADVDPRVFPVYLADVLDLTADGATVLIALDAATGTVTGTARLHLRPSQVDLPLDAAYVRGVAVHPDQVGRGIARDLMTNCAQRARDAGATGLYLHTAAFMTRAIGLYEGLGYQRTPARDTASTEHFGMTIQPPLHALAYHLPLR